jgi:GH43 family beta-xylosidase
MVMRASEWMRTAVLPQLKPLRGVWISLGNVAAETKGFALDHWTHHESSFGAHAAAAAEVDGAGDVAAAVMSSQGVGHGGAIQLACLGLVVGGGSRVAGSGPAAPCR